MKENHFQIQSALDGSYINIALQAPYRLDKTAIRVLNESCPEFLLPFGITDINNEITLKYKVPNAISLKYTNGNFTKQMLLNFYEGLLEPFVKGYNWFLDYHYVCVDPAYIYIDKHTVKASFLYIPEQSYRNTDEQIIAFLRNALNKISVTDDNVFLVQLYQYFNGGHVVFSDLDNMIKAEKNKVVSVRAGMQFGTSQPPIGSEAKPIMQQAITNTIARPIEQQKKAESTAQQMISNTASDKQTSSEDNDIMNALFGSASNKDSNKKKEKPLKEKKHREKSEKQNKGEKGFFGSGLFGKKKSKTQPAETQPLQMAPQTNQVPSSLVHSTVSTTVPINTTVEDSSLTEIEGCLAERCLALIESERAGAIAYISLEFPKDYITIGRDSNDAILPDICFDKSFTQVSRMHLRIERREDGYYAIDVGSGNHTLIDGQMMIPNVSYKLNAGSILCIAINIPIKYRVNI